MRSRIRTAWEQVKSKGGRDLVRTGGNDDGMTSVVTARTTCTDIDLCRENIDEFTLAFIAPLGAEHDGHCPAHQPCVDDQVCGVRTHRA